MKYFGRRRMGRPHVPAPPVRRRIRRRGKVFGAFGCRFVASPWCPSSTPSSLLYLVPPAAGRPRSPAALSRARAAARRVADDLDHNVGVHPMVSTSSSRTAAIDESIRAASPSALNLACAAMRSRSAPSAAAQNAAAAARASPKLAVWQLDDRGAPRAAGSTARARRAEERTSASAPPRTQTTCFHNVRARRRMIAAERRVHDV